MNVLKPADVDAAERQVRIDLAACYRLVAHFGMDDLVYTHITARVPGTRDQFLINPFGTMFGEVTPSSLVKIDLAGNWISPRGPHINPHAFAWHRPTPTHRHSPAPTLHPPTP